MPVLRWLSLDECGAVGRHRRRHRQRRSAFSGSRCAKPARRVARAVAVAVPPCATDDSVASHGLANINIGKTRQRVCRFANANLNSNIQLTEPADSAAGVTWQRWSPTKLISVVGRRSLFDSAFGPPSLQPTEPTHAAVETLRVLHQARFGSFSSLCIMATSVILPAGLDPALLSEADQVSSSFCAI